MNATKIFDLMSDGIGMLSEFRKVQKDVNIESGIQQYNPKLHTVKSEKLRPDKPILKPSPTERDPVTREPKMVMSKARVARIPLAIQKYIIEQKAAFALGNGITLKPSVEDSELFQLIKKNWDENKTEFYLAETNRRKMSETQSAIIFYSKEGVNSIDDFRLRFKIVSPAKGDKLIPFFDQDTDDLTAFAREYEVNGQTIYDLYVMNANGKCDIWRFVNDNVDTKVKEDEWEQLGEVINTPYPALPIVYWSQEYPECYDISELIEELEWGFSDYLTQMGYSADPILFGKGDSLSMPAAGSPGKFITGKGDADLKYVTPDNATESRKLQFEMLQKYIFSLSRSVLLDLETMKSLGDVSGAALDRYLIDAYMEATGKQQGDWGIGVQRMVNFMLKTWKEIKNEDLDIEVIFSKYSIESLTENIELAMKANGGLPVIDHEASITMAKTSDNPTETIEKINEQSNQTEI